MNRAPETSPPREAATPAGAHRRPAPTPAKRLALLIFLLSPLLVLAILVMLIYRAQQAGPLMHEPPVGAGAGQTGMHNQYGGLRPGQ